jgi:hypothetical protein
VIGERWIIHGMPHAWPGGTTDARYDGFTDAKAPSGAEGSWAFFRRYTKSDTSLPCAETPAPSPAPAAGAPRKAKQKQHKARKRKHHRRHHRR